MGAASEASAIVIIEMAYVVNDLKESSASAYIRIREGAPHVSGSRNFRHPLLVGLKQFFCLPHSPIHLAKSERFPLHLDLWPRVFRGRLGILVQMKAR